MSTSQAFNNTWDCRIHTVGKTAYVPQFPFFMEVSVQICKMVEESIAEANKIDDIFQEKETLVVAGMSLIVKALILYLQQLYYIAT